MRELIAAAYPEHGILGEEHGSERPEAEFVWVLDPIDGTKSFITGRPLFGTLIALAHARPAGARPDRPVDPARALGRLGGAPSVWNGRPIRVRPCPELERCGAVRDQPGDVSRRRARPRPSRGSRPACACRMFGGDCYAYGLLAMGFADLIVETSLAPYDFMALVPVIEGAGGRITDWAGQALDLASCGQVVASGDARVHAAACSLVRMPAAA